LHGVEKHGGLPPYEGSARRDDEQSCSSLEEAEEELVDVEQLRGRAAGGCGCCGASSITIAGAVAVAVAAAATTAFAALRFLLPGLRALFLVIVTCRAVDPGCQNEKKRIRLRATRDDGARCQIDSEEDATRRRSRRSDTRE
jgi:hypothetical protein